MEPLTHQQMYIDGEWVDAVSRFEIVNPANEELVATVARGGVDHADRAVDAAARAHAEATWRSAAPADRAELLDAIAAGLERRIDELVALEVAQSGVTVRQAHALHIGAALVSLRHFAQLARSYPFDRPGPQIVRPRLAAGAVRREPIGVVAGIVPWNFPMLLAVWKLGPALAAGNCIVLKPDEKTPATLLEVARAAHEAGLPPGVLNVVTGEGEEVGRRLSAHPDVRKIAFTGSTAVGRLIAEQAAANIKKVTLELGGKGPNIVLPDADVDTAVEGALFAFCLYQGQACESGTRLLLPDSLHDEFVAKMISRAKLMKVGDPADFDTDMGPIISAEQ